MHKECMQLRQVEPLKVFEAADEARLFFSDGVQLIPHDLHCSQ